jgi:hypothetical protein
MLELTCNQYSRMLSDQDNAARDFWYYPDEDWQTEFQEDWLKAELGITSATFGNLFFGEAIN